MFCMDWAVMLLGEDKELSPNFCHQNSFFYHLLGLVAKAQKIGA